MVYSKRFDGRKFDELRKIEAKVGIIKNAKGSAMFRAGNTVAYAAVYGPKGLYPRYFFNQKRGVVRVNYSMMAFSGSGERVKPGSNRRAKELGMVIENALVPAIDLKEYTGSAIDVFIELPQTDAGTRAAGVCAASLALADAGMPMKDMVAAVAFGRVGDKVVVDLNYDEEAYDEEDGGAADIPLAMMPNLGKVTLLQMDGHLKMSDMKKVLEMAQPVMMKIYEVQKNALKEKIKNLEKEEKEILEELKK